MRNWQKVCVVHNLYIIYCGAYLVYSHLVLPFALHTATLISIYNDQNECAKSTCTYSLGPSGRATNCLHSMHIATGVKWQFQCQFCLNVSALYDHSLASEHSYQHKQLVDSLIELVSCDHNSMNFAYTVLSFFLSRVNSNAKWKINNIQFFSVENGSKLTTWLHWAAFFPYSKWSSVPGLCYLVLQCI